MVEPTPLKNDGVKVSLDDDIPNMMGKNNPNVPNHQPDKLSNYPSTWFLQITCLLHPVAIPSWKKGLRFYTIVWHSSTMFLANHHSKYGRKTWGRTPKRFGTCCTCYSKGLSDLHGAQCDNFGIDSINGISCHCNIPRLNRTRSAMNDTPISSHYSYTLYYIYYYIMVVS